nr:MAG: Putative binding domain, N-terminal [Bacteriophage sp.]
MEKNFLNITPESGNGNQELTINAKANISLEDREEMLRIRSSTGKEAKVRIIQEGNPFIANIRLRYQNVVPRLSTKKVYCNVSQTYTDNIPGIPTTTVQVANVTTDIRFGFYFSLLIRKSVLDEILPLDPSKGERIVFCNDVDLNGDGKGSIIPYVREEINIKGTQFYWIDAGSMDPVMQGNYETTIGLGYFLDRVELIQLHRERFHLYIS